MLWAGKNLRLMFLGFNVRTVARGRPTLDTGDEQEEDLGLYTKIN